MMTAKSMRAVQTVPKPVSRATDQIISGSAKSPTLPLMFATAKINHKRPLINAARAVQRSSFRRQRFMASGSEAA